MDDEVFNYAVASQISFCISNQFHMPSCPKKAIFSCQCPCLGLLIKDRCWLLNVLENYVNKGKIFFFSPDLNVISTYFRNERTFCIGSGNITLPQALSLE